VNLLVDTSVWSLALRRNNPQNGPEVDFLRRGLDGAAMVYTAGIILQELLQGIRGPKSREAILTRFSSLPFLLPDRADHVAAAEIHGRCRRRGLQIGTIDALLAQLCVRHRLTMLTTDRDFSGIAAAEPLAVWKPGG
jgi:predicted nucleic acid-binding protein